MFGSTRDARFGPSTRLTARRHAVGRVARVASATALVVGCGGSDRPAEAPQSGAPPAASPVPAGGSSAEKNAASAAPQAARGWPFGPAPSPDERAAQLERLKKDPGPLKSNWVPPGRSERYGHAEGLVAAPVPVVKARLEDFARYKDLAGPKFKTVRVVDKQGIETDVYFQLPIMKGLITINYVTRFPPAKPAEGGSGDVVEGRFVKGNIKDMHIAFTVRPGPDESSSVMVCDLILLPNIPAPQSALDEELRDACGDAINAVRRITASAPSP